MIAVKAIKHKWKPIRENVKRCEHCGLYVKYVPVASAEGFSYNDSIYTFIGDAFPLPKCK